MLMKIYIYNIMVWPANGAAPYILWATPTKELAEEDIKIFCKNEDTYTIEETTMYINQITLK